jgi:ketosteroid isomerase-like protein
MLADGPSTTMPSRPEIESSLRNLYEARVRGDLGRICELFTSDARFEIASASYGDPVAVNARGIDELTSLLTLLIRAFRIYDQMILSIIIDGSRAAVHWRAAIYSKITGATLLTEFMDIVEFEQDRICSYIEFFVPR